MRKKKIRNLKKAHAYLQTIIETPIKIRRKPHWFRRQSSEKADLTVFKGW